jgi:hypothetical protein
LHRPLLFNEEISFILLIELIPPHMATGKQSLPFAWNNLFNMEIGMPW